MIDDLVSIIMSAYNVEKYIAEAIESVLKQTYTNWELIIVNDCSIDATEQLAKKYQEQDERIKLHSLPENKGVANARNIALQNAVGRYIAFLDSDDIWLPEKLEKQLDFMKINNYVFTYHQYRHFASKDKVGQIVKIPSQLDYMDALKGNSIGCLTVCIDNCSNNQAKKRLELATKKYQSLPRTSRKELEDDRKGSITAVYDYAPLVGIDSDDPLQRFGYVKVEGTSFTVSEPFTPLEIEPILYTYATEEQRQILQAQYDVGPFRINTIRLERIFADKIFAAEFYYERKMYFDVAKHLYDVSVMLDLEQIQKMIGNQQMFLEMLGYKRLEETRRTGSDLAEKKFSDFQLLGGFGDNAALRKDYQNMQRNYVFLEEDVLSFDYVVEQWKKLREILFALA